MSAKPPLAHPQIERLAQELDVATERARRIVTHAGDRLHQRPGPDRWSAAESIAHLNLTAEAILPLIDSGLREAETHSPPASVRYRRDVAGWLLSRWLEPPYRQRVKTPPRFVPSSVAPAPELLARFVLLQDELEAYLRRASGLDLNRVRVVSPFNSKVRYNLYSAFHVITAHERRHLYQAETALAC